MIFMFFIFLVILETEVLIFHYGIDETNITTLAILGLLLAIAVFFGFQH